MKGRDVKWLNERPRRMRGAGIAGVLLLCGTVSTGAGAQSAPADAPPPPAEASTAPDGADRARLRESLERRREMTAAMQARLEDAIGRLDRGEPIDAELAEGRGFMPEMVGDGAGGPRWQRGVRQDARDSGGPVRADGGDAPSVEEIRRLRAFIDENLPVLAERLRNVEQHDPQAAPRMIGRIAPRLREAFEARERSPEVFRLRVQELEQGFQLLDAARRTRRVVETEGPESAAAVEAKARFRELAGAHFDTQVRLQNAEVADLEARIAELRAEIDRKTTHRDEEIDARVEDVLRNTRPGRPEGAGRPSRSGSAPGSGRRGPE